MFKKLVSVVPVAVVVAFAFTGCATAGGAKDAVNTIKYAEQTTPKVITTPTLADLDVSDAKVQGAAKGSFSGSANKAKVKDRLEQSAIAQALQQKEGADVLIGVVFYYQENYIGQTRGEITVTAIGYPARYKNFRSMELPENDGKGKAVSVSGSLNFGEKGSDRPLGGGMIPSILQGGNSAE
ncbi:MAG: hypothetical protein FWB85_02290 [Chitinispirillia bacterium]|nr:hypothetical protein [Chitinispirillia bacterium]MCL2241235.1 hypothetical protein [Chitinispirillia bacterium]